MRQNALYRGESVHPLLISSDADWTCNSEPRSLSSATTVVPWSLLRGHTFVYDKPSSPRDLPASRKQSCAQLVTRGRNQGVASNSRLGKSVELQEKYRPSCQSPKSLQSGLSCCVSFCLPLPLSSNARNSSPSLELLA